MVPVLVSLERPVNDANPKSRIFTWPLAVSRDVLWLDVAMNDALLVCFVECFGYLNGDA